MSKHLQIQGLMPRICKKSNVNHSIFSQISSEQFWKQNTL